MAAHRGKKPRSGQDQQHQQSKLQGSSMPHREYKLCSVLGRYRPQKRLATEQDNLGNSKRPFGQASLTSTQTLQLECLAYLQTS